MKLCMTILAATFLMTGMAVEAFPTPKTALKEENSIVWGVTASPYVRKVLVALEYKEVPYTLKEILPLKLVQKLGQQAPEEFIKASPLGKIPALQEGNFSIADSSVIVAYLEKKYPQKPLYPSSPSAYAKALWLEKYSDTEMSDVIHQKIFIERVIKPNVLSMPTDENVTQEAIKIELPKIFNYLETQLIAGKKYLVGNSLTIADIAITTHFVSLQLAKVELNAKQWPKLAAYIDGILKEEAFAKALSR